MVLNPSLPFASQVTLDNSIYVIRDVFNLANTSVGLPSNCVLRFEGGKICNGSLVGNETRIENPSNDIIFDNIVLTSDYSSVSCTGWVGSYYDVWFFFNPGEPVSGDYSHYNIVKSVCQFDQCYFSHRDYYISKWNKIYLRPLGVSIYGNHTVFILPHNKGPINQSGWGNLPQYETTCLFEKESPYLFSEEYSSGENAGDFCVSGLTILDNALLFGGQESNWGELIHYNSFTIYCIFRGAGSFVHFNNVHYDGGGGLWADYNYRTAIHKALFEDCHVKTAQFAFELLNAWRLDLAADYPLGGHCSLCHFLRCSIFNYSANHFVGPLSVVMSGEKPRITITKQLTIENSIFESQFEANLELSGCESVLIRNNLFLSTQCSSSIDTDSLHQPVNLTTRIIGNVFDISNSLERAGSGLRVFAGDIDFIQNVVYADFSKLSTGGIIIQSFGSTNVANIVNNCFILKRTDLTGFKSLISFDQVTMNLWKNTYSFQNSIAQGYEVNIGGNGNYINLETENDPRFRNVGGGDYVHWNPIPEDKRSLDGFIKTGEIVTLNDNLSVGTQVEFDLRVIADSQGYSGQSNIFSFQAASSTFYVQSYFGTIRILRDTTVYSSNMGVCYSLPNLGFNSNGQDLGFLKIVFWNNPENHPITTSALVYINEYQVDSISLSDNILSSGVSNIVFYGASFLKIKYYRIRNYGKILTPPRIAEKLTLPMNPGFLTSGPTSSRPSSPNIGFMFFDTCFHKPVFFTGSGWVDASGTST